MHTWCQPSPSHTIETRTCVTVKMLKIEMEMSEPEWYLFSLCVTRRCVRRLVCCLPPPPPPPPLPLPPSFPPPPAKQHNTMNTPPDQVLVKHFVIWENVMRCGMLCIQGRD
ncbi:hypothetical protein Zmor_008006 [Zophobas morio]|uniref:Uncharacterized protein n=1 Tax=Zophobas morio TaxID=2755281 RepID=A0AA38J3A2_9CUCU|nr:hypothetical protein Zmor_008006 [Zophobas morio]